ncbi:N-acetylmuramoyl-L-alanine amidase [Nonomuraea mesophila]|uniref:N-acetylmuramoyl-L-alanine amidase n=2 Tax=Nonomuraea mesophila TaxID=2530382 RepID=A0A4R5EJU2_9ACTN|nr:N-acetylmuramoyl-L-alanine amidase [Nonomuraea mesophila]
MQLWLAVVLVATALTAPALPADPRADLLSARPAGPGREVAATGRQSDFAAAAREYGVPESVLLGVAYLQSRWDANGGRPSTAGGYGPMHLVDTFPAEALDGTVGDALGDARGDEARPMPPARVEPLASSALRLAQDAPAATLPQAGRLAGVAPARLRTDPVANIRAGAALLASYQERPSADPADWYDAVARYSGSEDPATARGFADEVFTVMREGVERRTDDGHLVRLDPVPDLPPFVGSSESDPESEPWGEPDGSFAGWDTPSDEQPGWDTPGVTGEGHDSAKAESGADLAECPTALACEWMPAAHKRFGKKKHRDYGNHDRLSRTRSVDYIVIHDTEGTYRGIPSLVRNPKYVSWHYTIRSRDGHVAQHVATNDIAWHAGNWDVNTRSIGIEHEGYLAKGGAWYTEAMYRASARLVRFLAAKHDIPLDRAHILGHDNVPGTTPATVAGMHEDPGPYWDWAHYFHLMHRPFKAAGNGESVIIRPSYATHRPRFTGCDTAKPAKACPPHGASAVLLHTAPKKSAPLVRDVGKHGNKPSTRSVYDHGARASTGQRYAVAEREGDWTAIWYLGQKAWFHNPASDPTAVPAEGPLVTPRRDDVKVYGRAYPEKSAYKLAAHQPLRPLPYTIGTGQTYSLGDTVTGSYYAANAFKPSRHVTTTGRLRYHQIQLGHRVMFVKARDMRLLDRK